jgi:hypothetical protein
MFRFSLVEILKKVKFWGPYISTASMKDMAHTVYSDGAAIPFAMYCTYRYFIMTEHLQSTIYPLINYIRIP